MNAQVCGPVTELSSDQRLLGMLRASPEQKAAIDGILSGRLAPRPPAQAPEVKGPLLLRVKDAAEFLGVHRATMWRLVKAGRLETVELLGSLRVRRADVVTLAGGHQGKGKEGGKK